MAVAGLCGFATICVLTLFTVLSACNDSSVVDPDEDRLTPVPVAGGHVFLSIEAGGSQTCGMTDSGSLYCWGWDEYGQLGSGHHHGEVIDTPVLVNGSR